MNTVIRKNAVVAAALAGIALSGATPASADPPNGSYTYINLTHPNVPHSDVALTPCGPDCTHWTYTNSGVEFDFHLQGNRWVSNRDPLWSFDKDSLQGTQKDLPGPRPSPDFNGTQQFVLTKNG
jgi:hypothetical protein